MNLARKNQGFYYDTRGRINYGISEVLQTSSYISSKIRLIRTILTVLLPFLYLPWGMRNGTCRFSVYLFFPWNPLNVLVILYVVGNTFSRRTQRCWNRGKWFRIDGEIPEISFTNFSLRGGMKSEPLTKPPGSLCDDEQLLWMSLTILEQGERRFPLESSTEVQRKPGHHKAESCFPHISSSVLWILVKLGTYGKLFSRGI